MNQLLHKIISTGSGYRYYRISNADGKSWLLPAKNMRVALGLYQPSGRNGKLLKALFPWLHRLPFVRRAIKAETICCTLQQELKELLQGIFGCTDLEFAIFEGTPCVHQKMTIQICCGNKILGYCKASDNKDILQLFEKEAGTLAMLAQKGVTNIPQALHCGTLHNGVHIFVQSTAKTSKSQMVHTWGPLQEQFLATLHEKTKQALPFEESDYRRAINALQEHIEWLPTPCREVVATAIAGVMAEYHGKMVEYSACHADFTPWNMFVERGKLFVFDFEYAALTYPPEIDRCHYELQTAIFEKRMSREEILEYITGRDVAYKRLLRLYLLDVISRFTIRERGNASGDIARSLDTWCHLLKNCTL